MIWVFTRIDGVYWLVGNSERRGFTRIPIEENAYVILPGLPGSPYERSRRPVLKMFKL